MAELTPAVAESILVAWLFALGACVGSFLNVVVYRLPAGKSLVFPGSHCPACAHPIRWHDNVPILSWLFLRGRCRDCAAQISLRYPAVEAITAALFVLVGVVEVVLSPLGIGQSAGIVTYHLLLLCTLLAGALIEYDGHRLPVRLFLPALVAGWLAPMVWPFLHPVSAWEGLNGPVAGFVDGPAGLGLGMLLGGALWWLPGTGRSRGLLLGPATVGLFLGWQATLVLTLAAAVFWWPTSAIRRLSSGPRTIPLIAWLALCALGWILAWGWLVSR